MKFLSENFIFKMIFVLSDHCLYVLEECQLYVVERMGTHKRKLQGLDLMGHMNYWTLLKTIGYP